MADDFLIGHYTNREKVSGCTVIICPPGNTASCYAGGASPGTRELVLLHPEKKMQTVNAVLLTGGSAYGLSAAGGVMRYLYEQGRGYKTAGGIMVPIVPAAVIFDLNLGSTMFYPGDDAGYEAAQNASPDFGVCGTVGAGTGATVGKWAGFAYCMKGGLGTALLEYKKIFIRAVAVVNAVGDVFDEQGEVLAGARDEKTVFACKNPDKDLVRLWEERGRVDSSREHTVLTALLTNAALSKLQAYKLAQSLQLRLARVFFPYSTLYDGDVTFVVSAGSETVSPEILSELGGRTLHKAVISAVCSATALAGIPSCSSLREET
jgi:L-aminopeptidase/D-esterase-like protein